MANNLQSQWLSGDWTDQWGGDDEGVVSWSPSTEYTGSDSAMVEAYLNTGDTDFFRYVPDEGEPLGTVDEQYEIRENLPWQQSVRDFLGIGEKGAKFFAGMAGGKTPPRKPPRTERASSRGREARTSRIEDAKRMTSRQLATLRRPPVEVDFDKLINGNVITKVKGAMEEYIQNPTGPKGTKITLSSAGLGAIRSTKKLT
jgi:hypothetical protein